MSCGKPHETPCSEVLARVCQLHRRRARRRRLAQIRQHLDECGPCLREYGLEEVVKRLVHKHCGSDLVPSDLRSRVLIRIQQVRVELEVTEFRAD